MKLSCIVFQNKHVKIIRINYTIKYAKLHKMVIYRAFLVFFSNFGSILTYFIIVFGPWEFLKSLWWFWNDFININSYLLRPFIIDRPSVPCSRMNWLEMKISLTYKKVKEPSCTLMWNLFIQQITWANSRSLSGICSYIHCLQKVLTPPYF